MKSNLASPDPSVPLIGPEAAQLRDWLPVWDGHDWLESRRWELFSRWRPQGVRKVRESETTGMSEFRFDVFLSDTSADRARVKRIAERLRGAKLRVWWDEWAIKPGATSSWRSNRA